MGQKYNATVMSTTGAPGTGKTYYRCARFVIDWWLPEEKGVHYSNFPINLDALQAKYPEAVERVHVIPEEELKAWMDFESGRGPWTYFNGVDIQGAHFALDECHLWLPRQGEGSQKNAKRWGDWLREIRHSQCTVEFLTQDPGQVHKVVEMLAAVRLQLVNPEDQRDPIFGVQLGDWAELRAYFTGSYEVTIWQLEQRRVLEKWIHGETQRFTLDPYYFQFYDSYNSSIKSKKVDEDDEEVKAKPTKLREFQKRSRLGFWWWFFKRNAFRLASRVVAACVLLWLCFGGGLTQGISYFLEFVKSRAAKPAKTEAVEDVKKPVVPKSATPGKEIPPASTVHREKMEAPAIAPQVEVKKVKNEVATVRSETVAHRPLETPPSGEQQQKTLPRLTVVSSDYVALDDGQIVKVGDSVGEYILRSVEFERRRAKFQENVDGGGFLVVPVGGPVGNRLLKKSEGGKEQSGASPVSGFLPAVNPE